MKRNLMVANIIFYFRHLFRLSMHSPNHNWIKRKPLFTEDQSFISPEPH